MTFIPQDIKPTKRAVVDTGRACPLRCRMCYHKHSDYKGFKTFEQIKKEVDQAKARGCDWNDIRDTEQRAHKGL